MKQTLGLLALLLVACVPAVSNYYRPSASGGTAINDQCGAVAPASTMKFETNGVDVRVTGGKTSIQIQVRVPKGTTAAFEHSSVALGYGGSNRQAEIKEFSYYDREARKSVSIPATGQLVGKDETFALGNVEPRLFQTFVERPAAAGEHFELLLPSIRVNGIPHSLPRIQFQEESGFGIYPVNC